MNHAKDIRPVLIKQIASTSAKGTVIVPEFCIGNSIADIAVFTPDRGMVGIEIKSAAYNLKRFPRQVIDYGRHFSRNIICADKSHIAEAVLMIDPSWGIYSVADSADSGVSISPVRVPEEHDPDLLRVALLLWDSEMRTALTAADALRGWASKPKRKKAQRLVDVYGSGIVKVVNSTIIRRALVNDLSDGRWERSSMNSVIVV